MRRKLKKKETIASNIEIFGNKEAWQGRFDGEGGVQLQNLGVGDLRCPA